jgi:hypothetical protein
MFSVPIKARFLWDMLFFSSILMYLYYILHVRASISHQTDGVMLIAI